MPLLNDPLIPESAAPGSHGFILTVNGTGFVSGSIVTWNGSPHVTTFVSPSQVSATIPASDLAAAGSVSVTVVNPAPGGGTSNVAFFQVVTPAAKVGLAAPSPSPLTNIVGAYAVIAADVNNDGKLDLVVGGAFSVIDVLLGNGDGTFQPATAVSNGFSTYSIAVGDFNHHGNLDLAVADTGGITILLGQGDGTFRAYRRYATDGTDESAVIVGDFNGDGNLDLAIGHLNGMNVSILLGNGDGTFQPYVDYPLPDDSPVLLTADFNGDGYLDLAALGDHGINVLLGNGDGTFQLAITTAGTYTAFATADFNGDGIPDLAATGTDGTSVLMGNGNGSFAPPVNYPGTGPLVIGDFNGDGNLDLASLSFSTSASDFSAISILRGNGDGTFRQPLLAGVQPYEPPVLLVLGDFNGDGRLDLASTLFSSATGDSSIAINLQTTAVVSPGVLSFPLTLYGNTTASETFTVTNTATAPLNIAQVAVSGANPADFLIATNTCQGVTLPAAGVCTVGLWFAPSAPGVRTAVLNITDDALAGPQTAGLEGNCTALYSTPTALNFGNVSVGTTSPYQIVTVTNATASLVTMEGGVFIVGPEKGDFYQYNTCGRSLSPNASCSVVVQFIPTATGSRTAWISVDQSIPSANPALVPLSGSGT